MLTFEWVLIAVPKESALHNDYLLSQILTLKLERAFGGFVRDNERADIGHVLPVEQMGAI